MDEKQIRMWIELYKQYLEETVEERIHPMAILDEKDKDYGKTKDTDKGDLNGFMRWLIKKIHKEE